MGYFAALPVEVVVHILSFLSTYEVVWTVHPLNRAFRDISEHKSIWKLMYRKRWGDELQHSSPCDVTHSTGKNVNTRCTSREHWKREYMLRHVTEANYHNGDCTVSTFMGDHRFYCLCYSGASYSAEDDGQLWAGNADGLIVQWEWESPSSKDIALPHVTFRAHDNAINCIRHAHGRLFTCSCDHTIKIWTPNGPAVWDEAHSIDCHSDAVQMLRVVGERLFSCSLDGTLHMYDVHQGCKVDTLADERVGIRCMYVDGGHTVMWGDSDGVLCIKDIREKSTHTIVRPGIKKVMCMDGHDARIAVAGDHDSTLHYPIVLYDRRAMSVPSHKHYGHTGRIWSMQLSGAHMFTGSRDYSLRMWNVETGTSQHLGKACNQRHINSIYWLQQSASRIFTASADHSVKMWNFSPPPLW